MTFDPYRILGLRPGASLDEVKRAYRALAKRYHPDAAGEEETAHFLAIQAAYESLLRGRGRVVRGWGMPGPSPAPWQADPARARATREAYRARRGRAEEGSSGRAGERSAGGDDATGPAGPGRARPTSRQPWWRTNPPRPEDGRASSAAPDGDTGAGQASASRPESAGPRSGGRRRPLHRRKTTLTSTTYDEVKDPFEPGWSGGSWYGTSTGTYWTINPREYADPRKHGPEYQARARRAHEEDGVAVDDRATVDDAGPVASAPWRPPPDDPSRDPWSEAGPAAGVGADPASPEWGWAPAPGAPTARGAPGRQPAASPVSSGTGAVGAAVLAGGITAIPSILVLLTAGATAQSSTFVFAFLAPPIAALVAGTTALALARRRA